MSNFDHRLATMIREQRLALHLSQEELAERIDKTTGLIGQIERGECLPGIDTFYDLAQCLRLDVETLFYGNDSDVHSDIEQIRNLTEHMNQDDRTLIIEFAKVLCQLHV